MSADIVHTIKASQPFKTGPEHPNREPLAVISELNNIDKHRLFHGAELWFFGPAPVQPNVPLKITAHTWKDTRLEDGVELARCKRTDE